MRFVEYMQISLAEVKRSLLRSILTILGIVIGVSAMIAVLSVGEAGRRSIYSELEKFGINRLFIYPGDSAPQAGILTGSDADYLAEHVEGIKSICQLSFSMGSLRAGSRSMTVEVVGTTPSLKQAENKILTYGRFFNENDMEYMRNVIVLSSETSKDMFGHQNPCDETVELNGKRFRVIGVEENTTPLYSSMTEAKNYIPINTFNNMYGRHSIDEISVSVDSSSTLDYVNEKCADILLARYGGSAIKTLNLAEETANAESILATFTLIIGAVALISLLVGGIGIMNIMLVTVRERTREIGVRKALGAKNNVILKQFLCEAVLYALLGSLFGIILGIALSLAAEAVIGLKYFISAGSAALAVVFSALTGIAFGIAPAYKAAKLDACISLRQS